jgi:hypothetical protein
MNKLHPISVFDTKAATEPNINMPPMHIDTKNSPLDAMITFDLRLLTVYTNYKYTKQAYSR